MRGVWCVMLCIRSRMVRDRILKFDILNMYEKISGPAFFSFLSDLSLHVELWPFLARLYEVQGELLQSPWSSASVSVSASAFLSHCDNVLFPSFLKAHISTAAHQKAFIFGP